MRTAVWTLLSLAGSFNLDFQSSLCTAVACSPSAVCAISRTEFLRLNYVTFPLQYSSSALPLDGRHTS